MAPKTNFDEMVQSEEKTNQVWTHTTSHALPRRTAVRAVRRGSFNLQLIHTHSCDDMHPSDDVHSSDAAKGRDMRSSDGRGWWECGAMDVTSVEDCGVPDNGGGDSGFGHFPQIDIGPIPKPLKPSHSCMGRWGGILKSEDQCDANSAADDDTDDDQNADSLKRLRCIGAPFYKLTALRVVEVLGCGRSAVVLRAQSGMEQNVAVKAFLGAYRPDAGRSAGAEFHNEYSLLSLFSHPGVVTLRGWGCSGGQYALILEHLRGGTLREAMELDRVRKPMAPHMQLYYKVCWALQAVEILAHLHSKKILHRDLKADHFVFRDPSQQPGELVLVDFSFARRCIPHVSRSEENNSAEGTAERSTAESFSMGRRVTEPPLRFSFGSHTDGRRRLSWMPFRGASGHLAPESFMCCDDDECPSKCGTSAATSGRRVNFQDDIALNRERVAAGGQSMLKSEQHCLAFIERRGTASSSVSSGATVSTVATANSESLDSFGLEVAVGIEEWGQQQEVLRATCDCPDESRMQTCGTAGAPGRGTGLTRCCRKFKNLASVADAEDYSETSAAKCPMWNFCRRRAFCRNCAGSAAQTDLDAETAIEQLAATDLLLDGSCDATSTSAKGHHAARESDTEKTAAPGSLSCVCPLCECQNGKSDVWQIGCLLREIFGGLDYEPFVGLSRGEIANALLVKKETPDMPISVLDSDFSDVQSLIDYLCVRERNARISGSVLKATKSPIVRRTSPSMISPRLFWAMTDDAIGSSRGLDTGRVARTLSEECAGPSGVAALSDLYSVSNPHILRPFRGHTEYEEAASSRHVDFNAVAARRRWAELSMAVKPQILSAIFDCLQLTPEKRPTAAELAEKIRDAFALIRTFYEQYIFKSYR